MNRSKAITIALLVSVFSVAIDQGTKILALENMEVGNRTALLGDLFGLQLAFNPGAALSFAKDATWLITLFGGVVVLILIIAAFRTRDILKAIAFGLIIGGAVGNLLDRLLRPPGFGVGYVTDFLAYGDLFIGNIADVIIFVGAALLVISILRTPAASEPEMTPEDEQSAK